MTAPIPDLASQYDPNLTESKWQAFWEENQVFKADPSQPGDPFCVVIPPPNVTGSLHMGHAFENALIDAIVRYRRMTGHNTLWLPGTDHASIAVQTLLEKELKQQGKTRQDVGREAFLNRAWEWKEESGTTIVNQLRRLGVSVDWTRERFTLDEGLSNAVLEAFTRLYDEGLIYRGNYLVNWCPASQSAVSDLEVESKEVEGNLWHFRYPLTDGSGFVEVATTRPETMLGDTAVAVNPNDDRYRHMVGKTLMLPIMNREIPIIADDYVDSSFGTGCVKVTPAHDPNDFEMGQRHSLPMISIMNKDGTLNDKAGEFQGQDRFVARKRVVQRLEELGALVKVESYKHTVPYSDRGKVPVEPLLSTQWFVKIQPLSSRALQFLDDQSDPVFLPERWTKVYRDWLVNLRDWCISRQLWWGHQIPAWYAISETEGEIRDNTPFVVARTDAEAREKAIAQFGTDVQLERDPDVLDTWFSSGLWPFSTMGWPQQTADLDRYYPTTTLVTGFDIIFFWVARMTMMAGHFTGKMPFKTVYIHGLVRDENNKKMSKSAGNGIDPLLLINKYGTDSLRYALIREVVGAGQDIRLEYNRKTDESISVEAARNFTNKLWNASRFVMLNLEGQTPDQLGLPAAEDLELCDRWILSRYHQTVQQSRQYADHYSLGEAAKGLYEFIWGDFCDWYIELVKSRLQQSPDSPARKVAQQVLAHVLEGTLRLAHPFLPHITEEIWQTLTQAQTQKVLALQSYPTADSAQINADLEQQFDLLIDTIRTIRNLRAEAEIKPGTKITANLESESDRERQILNAGRSYIQDLARVETLTVGEPDAGSADVGEPVFAAETEGVASSVDSARAAIADPSSAAEKPITTTISETLNGLGTYRKPAITLVFLLLTLFVFKLLSAVLGAFNSLPLFEPLFKLIGISYSAWFAYRYLRRSDTRQDLTSQLDKLRTTTTPGQQVPLPPTDSTQLTTLLQSPAADPSVVAAPSAPSSQTIAGVTGTIQILIPLAGVVDIATLRTKLQRDLDKVQAEVTSLSQRLSNANFVDKAPPEVVQTVRDSLAEAQKQAEILETRLNQL
jgi:valyl-tRNA synthetase